jgi:alkylated DNA repair dioxygenase AlkB
VRDSRGSVIESAAEAEETGAGGVLEPVPRLLVFPRGTIESERADSLFEHVLSALVPLMNADVKFKIHGHDAVMHRVQGLFALDASAVEGYRFSGQIQRAQQADETICQLIKDVNRIAAHALGRRVEFNAVLVNVYRDGTDYIGPHADSEQGLYEGHVVALSLGCPRKFRVHQQPKWTSSGASPSNALPGGGTSWDLATAHGQLMIMQAPFQEMYKHSVPAALARDRLSVPRWGSQRVSLTFRAHSK